MSRAAAARAAQRIKRGDTKLAEAGLRDFMPKPEGSPAPTFALPLAPVQPIGKTFAIETYGCQMNFADTEVVRSVLQGAGYELTDGAADADVLLLNTCAIREGAEKKIWNRLDAIKGARRNRRDRAMTVGVLGCMAERLKLKLLESNKGIDLIAGPDAYRDLPRLLHEVSTGGAAANVQLSLEETYADVKPVRTANDSSVAAYVSIMRGCNNHCSFCIVPFTRGRERSMTAENVVDHVKQLSEQGYKEVCLLGQNVNSYADRSSLPSEAFIEGDGLSAPGFKQKTRRRDDVLRFTELLHRVSEVDPEMRIRFTSPHPKDFPERLLQLMAETPNLCSQIHLPLQSGNSNMLERMRRGYSQEAFLELAERSRLMIPNLAISTDIITGFCGETEEEHMDTLKVMEMVKFEMAFMYHYSLREKTHADKNYEDDVPEETKLRRLREVIDLFQKHAHTAMQQQVGKEHLVLVEGKSRRAGEADMAGRADNNKRVNFSSSGVDNEVKAGDYVAVQIDAATSTSMIGTGLRRTTLQEFYA